eukprot:GHVU01233062.1.p1 GENE.GHVU01233062.1~~GHVU01233062.1.p1  ORF type:complete len:535 (-),score=85.59 GHVU01233062.1:2082-3686(-)
MPHSVYLLRCYFRLPTNIACYAGVAYDLQRPTGVFGMSGYGLRRRVRGGDAGEGAPPPAPVTSVPVAGTDPAPTPQPRQSAETCGGVEAPPPSTAMLRVDTSLDQSVPVAAAGGMTGLVAGPAAASAVEGHTKSPTGEKLLNALTPKERKGRVSEELHGVTRECVTKDGDVWWVRGKKVDELSSHDVRFVAAQIGCTGYSQLKRAEIQQLLKSHITSLESGALKYELDGKAVKRAGVETAASVVEDGSDAAASDIRLSNVMFHPDTINLVVNTGRIATREDLDTGEVKTQSKMWKKIAKKYADFDDESLATIHYVEEELRAITGDPGEVQAEEPEQLKKMWCRLKKHYKKAKKSYTKSGTHELSFWQFCGGHLATYNLHMHLQDHRDMLDLVTDELPAGCRAESTVVDAVTTKSSWGERKRAPTRVSGSTAQSEVATALLQYNDTFGGEAAQAVTNKRLKLEEDKLALEREALEQRRLQTAAEVRSARLKQWREVDEILEAKAAQLLVCADDDVKRELNADINALKTLKATLLN